MAKDTTLVDVLDTNYPLLIRLKERTPGTYSHSKAVSSLLESVAVALGIPERSLVIAGLYHDIGKTVTPKMFGENQAEDEDNPHDKLEPKVSLRYITAHIGDTAQILVNDPNVPLESIRWATQHHGNSIVKFFYAKAKEKNPDAIADNYRYPGSKPECLEAALLMICDILEASARSLQQAGKLESVNDLVERIIQELEQDQQLDDVEMTFGKLRTIKDVLKKELAAQYHQRIDYDSAKTKT